ncbi:MAG: NAD(P)/FAD-dependent oxidoreductase [Candidatus Izemoplasmatales bacterium]
MISLNEIKLRLDEALNVEIELSNIKRKIAKKYSINETDIQKVELIKKAIDARNKEDILFVYNVDVALRNESHYLKKNPKLNTSKPKLYPYIEEGNVELKHPIVVVGFGPSGIFASYILAKRGYPVVVIEQGEDVIERTKEMDHFLKTGEFNSKASILYGEGGAGTFSDGKLNTLVSDIRSKLILDIFASHGAPQEIRYINKPHIGTDVLKKVVYNMRQSIIKSGAVVRFNTKLTNVLIENNQLKKIELNHHEWMDVSVCLLGIGHSAKDTVTMLYNQSMKVSPKPFSIGVRIEHLQSSINEAQYGKSAVHPALGAADYKLSYHSPSGRTAYTFCMCPGGYVMPSNGEVGHLVTNGMSKSTRAGINANSALLVNVTPSDFPSDHPLSGFSFQEEFEKKAFILGGSNYHAPVQKVGDFLRDRNSISFGKVIPTYEIGTKFVKMTDLLPRYVTDTLKEALVQFEKQLKGFASDDAILTGVETRSSSPVRLERNEFFESSIAGIYPMGEGAGYAGGITSSAIDGIKTAEQIISKYRRK